MVVRMLNHTVSTARTSRGTNPITTDGSSTYAIRPNVWLNWRPKRRPRAHVLSVAELAECMCPDLCDRDHANE